MAALIQTGVLRPSTRTICNRPLIARPPAQRLRRHQAARLQLRAFLREWPDPDFIADVSMFCTACCYSITFAHGPTPPPPAFTAAI